ncbi:hypothetical protein ACLUWI_04490 [Limosilactobacillus mucosae]|uniref:hypothetical protein n=1 Tax=Limosilactobacillus mucosae TaxID=97478 RepID=UPI003993D6E5
MRWNNNHINSANYRALIRLAFAMAIITAMLMAILDHREESSLAISSDRIIQLERALSKKLSHDHYAKISVTSTRIILKRSAAATTDQQLKRQLDKLSEQTNQLQRQYKTRLPVYVQNQNGQIIAEISFNHQGWYRSQKGLKVKAVFGKQSSSPAAVVFI